MNHPTNNDIIEVCSTTAGILTELSNVVREETGKVLSERLIASMFQVIYSTVMKRKMSELNP